MLIGWVAIGRDGDPYQPVNGSGCHARKKPVTLYKTQAKAEYYSPVFVARPCYMGDRKEGT